MKATSTFLDHTHDDLGGRFRKPGTVVGNSPVSYPAQPPTSPWHEDLVPPEPPLGYSVNDLGLGEPEAAAADDVPDLIARRI
jgi:hypothetical protein